MGLELPIARMGALVDYSSSSSPSPEAPVTVENGENPERPAKKQRRDSSSTGAKDGKQIHSANTKNREAVSNMPPLPATFHDLYASTVRQSVVDDPSLHHGRKRQTPHVVGNWPSHVYIECRYRFKQLDEHN